MNRQTAAIYARVSTDDQAEKGYSLPSQIEACRNFASTKGFEVVSVHADDISGTVPIGNRPEGDELQSAIDTRIIGAVIVYQVDRLSRDIVDLLTTVRDWLRAGIAIYSLDVGQITSELDIVLVVKAWQGGDERAKIRERTMRGKAAKAKAGRVVGTGFSPYGYDYEDGTFRIRTNEARIVQLIYDLYVNGENGRLMSLRKIADWLTDLAIPRPGETMRWQKRGETSKWEPVSVMRIIRNETYCGIWRYGQEEIPVRVPAIVSRELWELAQIRRAYNSKVAKRKTKRDYLLRGVLFCGCGKRMVGSNGLYYCPQRYGTNGKEKCTEPFVKACKVEYIAWGYILQMLTNADEFECALREAQALEAEQQQPKQKELEHVIALLTATEYEAETVAATLKKVKGIVGEKLQVQSDEIDRRYQVLQVRKKKLEEELKSELTDTTIADLLQFREAVAVGLNNPTHEERRLWLELLQTRVTVTNEIAVVTCRLSGEEAEFELFSTLRKSSILQPSENEIVFTSRPIALADVLFDNEIVTV